MPFASKAQQRYFYSHRKELEKQGVDVDEWSSKTDYSKLPERVKKAGEVPAKRFTLPPDGKMKDLVRAHASAVNSKAMAIEHPAVFQYEPGMVPGSPTAVNQDQVPTEKIIKKADYAKVDWEAHSKWDGRSNRGYNRKLLRLWERRDPDSFYEAIEMGREVETEHSHDINKQTFTALDHLSEDKDYYPKLKKMEEGKLKVAAVLGSDGFDYTKLTREHWRPLIKAAQDRTDIHFDLENDEEADGEASRNLKINGEDFSSVKATLYMAGGDWESPAAYFRCQAKAGFQSSVPMSAAKCFVMIPGKDDGNVNLVKGEKGYHPIDGEAKREPISKEALWRWLEKELKTMHETTEVKAADFNWNRAIPGALVGSAVGASIGGLGSLLLKKDKEIAVRNALIGAGGGALAGGAIGGFTGGKPVAAATLPKGPDLADLGQRLVQAGATQEAAKAEIAKAEKNPKYHQLLVSTLDRQLGKGQAPVSPQGPTSPIAAAHFDASEHLQALNDAAEEMDAKSRRLRQGTPGSSANAGPQPIPEDPTAAAYQAWLNKPTFRSSPSAAPSDDGSTIVLDPMTGLDVIPAEPVSAARLIPESHRIEWSGSSTPALADTTPVPAAQAPSYHQDALGSVYEIPTPGRHEYRERGGQQVRMDMPVMSLTRGQDYSMHVDGMGEIQGTALGFDQHSGEIHLQAGNTVHRIQPHEILGGIYVHRKQAEVYPTSQLTAEDPPLRGDEVHVPLISNPFNTLGQNPDDAVDYENGYQYAQEAGAQGVSSLQPEQLAQWAGRSVAWRKGFAKGLKKMGRGDLAAALESTISEGHPMKAAIFKYAEASKEATMFRSQMGGLIGGLVPLALGTAAGAGLGHLLPTDSALPELLGGAAGATAALPVAAAGHDLGAGLGLISGLNLPKADYGKDEQGNPIPFQTSMPMPPKPTDMLEDPKFAGVFRVDGQNLVRETPSTLLANPAHGPGEVKAKILAAQQKKQPVPAANVIDPPSAVFTAGNRVLHQAV